METIIIEQLLKDIKQLTLAKAQAEAQVLVANELLKQKDRQIEELEALLDKETAPKEG